MVVVSLFFVLVPLLVVAALVIPAIVDLVTRVEHVPLWWAAPLVLLVPPALLNLAIPVFMDEGMDRVVVPMFGWGLLHLGAAGLLLALALGLAFSRGLRPGGDTLRRRRTSLAALAVLLVSLLIPWFPGLLWLLWLVPASWAGLLWVVALNRRGALRLERGKAVSASMLMASAVCFLIGLAHFLPAAAMVEPELEAPGIGAWVGSLAVLAVFVGGLRFLTGPPDAGPLLAAVASGATVLGPFAWDVTFQPIPPDVQAPAWVDLEGNPGPPLPIVSHVRCMAVVDASGTLRSTGDNCYSSVPYLAVVDARTPLDQVPPGLSDLMVGDGHHRITRYRRWGDAVWLLEKDGKAVVWDSGVPDREVEVDATLAPAIRRLVGETRPLRVEATPNWTVQQLVSICASMGPRVDCGIENRR